MKRSGLLTLLLAAPLAVMAQTPVFTDNFTNGSTTNHTSTPGGTPAASFTSYDIASTKAATTNTPIGNGLFKLALNGSTTGGFLEAQAVFTASPVSLETPGDYINMTYVFTNTAGSLLVSANNSSYILQGLYFSGGVPPLAGGLANSGLTAGSPTNASGSCAGWLGYVSRIASGAGSQAYTRPVQNGPIQTNANQDLIGNGFGSGTYGNPSGTTFGGNETNTITLNTGAGATYTVSYTIALTAAGTLTVTNVLYNGAGVDPNQIVFSQTNTATGTNVITTFFDSLCIAARYATVSGGTSMNPEMDLSSITITKNIANSPGPTFDITGGGVGCQGNFFSVGLNGSVSSNTYYLYTNGVFNGSVQVGSGSAFNFTPQEPVTAVPLTNTVIASNTVSGVTGPMGGQAIVALESAPIITNQPVSMTAALNSTATFTVGAWLGGSLGTVHYQWNLNGTPLTDNGHITGATNATLVISSITGGDAAPQPQGYSCVVTNDCGSSATSDSAGLTIGAAANLFWQGGNPNSNWDLTTTANFNNGSSLVVFHSGDNVTFDDAHSSGSPVVNIVGNFITPTLITENASGTYTLLGSGSISGNAALQMNGSGGFGTLNIVNANTYSGGTTINGGTLSVSNANYASLGTGPVTLSGGTLFFPIKGSATAGLSNIVNVTANSTLEYQQINSATTFGAVLFGPFTGSSSATLTINLNNSSTGFGRLRMYSPFTNNANIVLTSGGSEIEMAPYVSTNSNGDALDQFFTGVISGFGGHFVPRGQGNVIFSGQNTVSDTIGTDTPTISPPGGVSLLISSGNVGIGADSIPTTPPTITSGPLGIGAVAINANTNSEGGNCTLFSYGGAHTVANMFLYTTTTNDLTVTFKGSNDLTLSGEFDLANTGDSIGAQRTIQVTNTGATTLAGTIIDNSLNDSGVTVSGITKTGNGSLYLNGVNTYAGPTTNNSGLLAGSGSIAGPVFVGTNGSSASIGGGSAASIGTLTISNSLTLNGNVFIRVNKSLSPSQSNDVIFVTGALNNVGTGTVTVNNINSGASLAVGDTFQIFNGAVNNGSALTVTGGGVTWNNNLQSSGSISVKSTASGPTTNATITKVFLSGTNVVVSGTNNNVPNTSFHYTVITATNIATPLSNWTAVATGLPFTPQGTFNYTNPIVPGVPRQFIDVLAVP